MSPSWNLEQRRKFCTACQQITPAFVEKLVSVLNLFVSVNILGNVLDSFPSSSLFYVTYSVSSVGCC